MATRTDARKAVVSILFSQLLGNKKALETKEYIYSEQKIQNKQKEFADNLLNGVIKNLNTIDESIKNVVTDWKFEDIGSVEFSILRLATYELLYTEINRAIIINEALNIAKEFCEDKAPKFLNGILDNIKKAD